MNTLIKQKSERFSNLLQEGIKAFTKAGELVVEMLDEDQMTISEIAENSSVDSSIISRFEDIGRKLLVPELLIYRHNAQNYLINLPYSEQKRLIDGSVIVLLEDGDTMNISTKNLTRDQCRQVFNKKEVRPEGAQRAYLEAQKMKESVKSFDDEMPYKIVKGEVFFERGCALKASQLASILSQITAKK